MHTQDTDATDPIDSSDSTFERALRAKVLLAEYRVLLTVALVVLVALGGWMTYGAYAAPGETSEQRQTHAWSATGAFTHGATVEEETAVYEAGTRLSDEPLYFTAVTPKADVEFVAGYDAQTGENVDVDVSIDLVIRAIEEGEGGATYWSETESLASTAESDVSPGQTVVAAGELDVDGATDRIDEIESDLGASPGAVELFLAVDREVSGTIDGESRSGSETDRIDLEVDDGTYAFRTDEGFDSSYEESETVTVAATPGARSRFGGPALLIVGLAGLAGMALVDRRWPDPTPAARTWLEYRTEYDRYEEVITVAALPESVFEYPRADVDSLEALAQVGIDVGAVIVHEPRTGEFVVVHDQIVYRFEPPAPPIADDVPAEGGGGDETVDGPSLGDRLRFDEAADSRASERSAGGGAGDDSADDAEATTDPGGDDGAGPR